MTKSSPNDIEQRCKALADNKAKLNWGLLRFAGDLRALIVSFTFGLFVAISGMTKVDIVSLTRDPHFIYALAVFFCGFTAGYLCYELFCPPIVKKFHNLADFYEHQLSIKKLQNEVYPQDPFNANLEHVTEHYIQALGKNCIARYAALIGYVGGFAALVFLLVWLHTHV